ncbi:putative phage tail protein [Acidaminococcus intestini]|uniref:putative phage tail protein n=1 Tax=Acidaminococcus intestini TaxID=187327 RepID=UPI003994DE7D
MMKKITRNVRLEKYTPWVLKNAKEILAICQAENQEFNTLYGQIWRWFANTFIFNTDIAGVERWEKMLGIYPPEGASIFDRRAAIFLMVNGTTPYTEKSFEVLTDGMYHKGAVTLGVHPNSYTVVLNLADDMTERINEIRRYARLIIPANMTIQAARTVPVYSPVYTGTVVRKHCKSEVGRLAGDKIKRSSVSFNVARDIHEVDKADNIEITLNGLKPSPVMVRHGQEVSPSPTSQIGDFDNLFYVDADGNIRQKVGAPATFTRASTAVLGGRTYQVNEPRFMDNGLLCEPTTTNLAASVIDVTNASLNGWQSHAGNATFEVSAKETYNHSHSIHLKDGTYQKRVYFDVNSTFNTIYTLSCMAFVVSGSSFIRIEEGGSPWPGVNGQTTSATGKWVKLSLTYKVTLKDPILHCMFYAGEGDDVYIDDIQLEARPYATSFTPTSRDAADRLTIAEWVVNKPKWTCEFDLSVNDKQVNYERPVDFWVRGERSFRAEMADKFCVIKGNSRLAQIGKSTNAMTTPHRLAITWDQGAVGYYFDGKLVGTATETSGEKVLSSIWVGDCVYDAFNGCFKNFRFSSTVHTAEKIAADSKLDELPVEDDTVLYMPLKEDLSMYGKAVQ